jgi:flagellar hook-associated protein 1 FlgK
MREDADASVSASVSNINSVLSEFEKVNQDVVVGSQTGDDITDKLDQRDNLLSQLSKEVGIKTVTRPNNDVVIYTDSGVTLFETSPRKVTFKPTNAFDATTVGNAVYADGVQITGSDANMSVHGGRLAGLTQLRDITAPAFQKQLDETARGLITAFSETSQTNPASPAAPGLFTYLGATVVPPATLISGLAGQVTINPSVDPSQGGDISRLRDGGISNVGNPAYVYNTTGASGFSARTLQLTAALSATQSFDAQAGLDDSQSVAAYATASMGWLAEQRQQVSNALSYQTAVVTQSSTALSNATGVNLDDQMSRMLALENSYQASARLLSTVNAMFTALFDSMHP